MWTKHFHYGELANSLSMLTDQVEWNSGCLAWDCPCRWRWVCHRVVGTSQGSEKNRMLNMSIKWITWFPFLHGSIVWRKPNIAFEDFDYVDDDCGIFFLVIHVRFWSGINQLLCLVVVIWFGVNHWKQVIDRGERHWQFTQCSITEIKQWIGTKNNTLISPK